MESVIISYNILMPVLIMILTGMIIRKLGIIDEHTDRQLNALTFKLLLPVMMFNSIYKSSLDEFEPKIFVFVIISIMIAFDIAFVISIILIKDIDKRGVTVQAMVRSNFIVYGFAVASKFCNDSENALCSLVAAIVLPLFGIFSCIALSVFEGKKINVRKLVIDIIKNPLVLGAVLGLFALMINIKFPSVLESAMDSIAKSASPISLIALGGFLDKGMFSGRAKAIAVGVIGKLVLVPVIFITAAVLFGFRGAELAIILSIFAAPTATASFAMTQQMSGDDSLAAADIVVSCTASFATMFVFISILHSLSLI